MGNPTSGHCDILGNPLTEGMIVAVAGKNYLEICKIIKVHIAMIRVQPVTPATARSRLVYPITTVALTGQSATAYMLTHSGK